MNGADLLLQPQMTIPSRDTMKAAGLLDTLVVFRPVGYQLLLLRNFVTAISVELVRHL
jgi:hypothetical protein